MTDLTAKQRAVLDAICGYGLTVDVAARKLAMNPGTLMPVLSQVFAKLGVKNRAECCYQYGRIVERELA